MPLNCTDYGIIFGGGSTHKEAADRLIARVNEYVKRGYAPTGSVSVIRVNDGTHYEMYQAVVGPGLPADIKPLNEGS